MRVYIGTLTTGSTYLGFDKCLLHGRQILCLCGHDTVSFRDQNQAFTATRLLCCTCMQDQSYIPCITYHQSNFTWLTQYTNLQQTQLISLQHNTSPSSNFLHNDVVRARLILFNYKPRSTVIKPKTSPGSLVVMTWSIQSGTRNIAGGRRGWRWPVSGVLESTVRWATKTLVRFQPRAFFLFVFFCVFCLSIGLAGKYVCSCERGTRKTHMKTRLHNFLLTA